MPFTLTRFSSLTVVHPLHCLYSRRDLQLCRRPQWFQPPDSFDIPNSPSTLSAAPVPSSVPSFSANAAIVSTFFPWHPLRQSPAAALLPEHRRRNRRHLLLVQNCPSAHPPGGLLNTHKSHRSPLYTHLALYRSPAAFPPSSAVSRRAPPAAAPCSARGRHTDTPAASF